MVRFPRFKVQQYLDSVESLKTGSTFQRVSPYNSELRWAIMQNISIRTITIRLLSEDPSAGTLGQGGILGRANSNGEGGGVIVLPNPNLYQWWWATTVAADKMWVLRLLK